MTTRTGGKVVHAGYDYVTLADAPALDDPDYYPTEQIDYLTLDLSHLSSSLSSLQAWNKFQILGLETESPFLSVGPYLLRGSHAELIGTEILLQASPTDPTSYTPFTTTTSRIVFQPVSLFPRPDPVSEAEEEIEGPPQPKPKRTRKKSTVAAGGAKKSRVRKRATVNPGVERMVLEDEDEDDDDAEEDVIKDKGASTGQDDDDESDEVEQPTKGKGKASDTPGAAKAKGKDKVLPKKIGSGGAAKPTKKASTETNAVAGPSKARAKKGTQQNESSRLYEFTPEMMYGGGG